MLLSRQELSVNYRVEFIIDDFIISLERISKTTANLEENKTTVIAREENMRTITDLTRDFQEF